MGQLNKDDIHALAESAEAEATISASTEVVDVPNFWHNPHLRFNDKGDVLAPDIYALKWWLVHPDMGLSHVRYNLLSGTIDAELLPWDQSPHSWTDTDTSYLLAEIQDKTNGLVRGEKNVMHALAIVANDQRYDPLLDMLEGLDEWDGAPRADTLLVDFLGAEDTPYTRAATRHMLNGAVMRAYHPGCKFDEALVLSSVRQGIGKSTLLRKLAMRDEFFTDNLGKISTKEGPENMQGCWFVEICELESVRKSDIETVKQFLSRQEDRYREAYGRFSKTRPRRCIFVGTTNSKSFLADRTGNRRFLPVACDVAPPKLDIFSGDAKLHIEQAWAEVVHGYHENGPFSLVLPNEVLELADEQRDLYSVADPKDGIISAWVTSNCKPGQRVCIIEILECLFEIPRSEASKPSNKAMMNEISQILETMPTMKRLKGRPTHSQKYGQQRCWEYHPDG